jgi:short-subunit dehydrogenase
MPELDHQIAVITGANRGIGAAISIRLATMGATIVLVGRDEASLDRVQQQIAESRGRAETQPCDLLAPASIEALGGQSGSATAVATF